MCQLLQRRHTPHKLTDTLFGHRIQRKRDARPLSRYARKMDHDSGLARVLHFPHRDPSHLNRMQQVDIEKLIVRCLVVIAPETVKRGLVDPSTGHDDIRSAPIFLVKYFKNLLQLVPVCDVRAVEMDLGAFGVFDGA